MNGDLSAIVFTSLALLLLVYRAAGEDLEEDLKFDDSISLKRQRYLLRPEGANLYLYRTAVMAVIKVGTLL